MNSFPAFLSFAHIFLILKVMAKKAKSIVTLSSPTCRNLLYAMLYFICPKTASGSIHRLSLCLKDSRRIFVLYTGHFLMYPLAVLSRQVPMRFMCAPSDKCNNLPPHCNGDFPHGTDWEYNGNATLYGSSCT